MKRIALAAFAALAVASAADATVLNLDSLSPGEISTFVIIGDYKISSSPYGLSVKPVIYDNGGHNVLLSTDSTFGDDAILSRVDGQAFTLDSVVIGILAQTGQTGQGIGASNGASTDLNDLATEDPQTFSFGDTYKDVTWVDLNGLSSAYYDQITVSSSVGSDVPEPASWALMVGGFGMLGGALRRKKAVVRFA